MKHETFFDNFEVLAEAPNGVQKLRELILQLAVRGKLVAQDERDEPASVLLKSIRDQIKKSSNSIEENEMPYNIPKTWECVRLGDILVFEYGDGLPKSKRAKNAKYPVYGSNGIVGYHDEFLIDKPGIIVGRKGSCGALNICFEPFWATDVSYYIIPPTGMDLKFAYILLKSLNLERLGKVIKPGLNRNEAYQVVTSLPPYNEQHRIVAKVDQLMSLCDELEARQQKKREIRAHLNSAALDRLLAARAPGEFAEGWRRISDNFDLLYDAPENVGKLKHAILQLAVMGKLVDQDEKDEPATELLTRIRTKKGYPNPNKLKKEMSLTSIQPEELPYNSPIGWEWVKLSEISERIHYGFTASADHTSTDVKLLRITDIQNNQVNWKIVPGCQIDDKDFPKYELHQNDILIARTGGTIGKTFLVKEMPPKAVFASYLIRVIPSPELLARYLKLFLESPFYWDQIRASSSGTGQPNVNGVALSKLITPIPPLAEQRRIVARVDQFMSLCDKLEAGLLRSQADSERVMEAVVGRMLAGGESADLRNNTLR